MIIILANYGFPKKTLFDRNLTLYLDYSIVKDSNADLTVEN